MEETARLHLPGPNRGLRDRKVLPHENILAKPMDDRLNLLRSTRSNFDSVFGLYSSGEVEKILIPFLMNEPDATATDKAGVVCNLWKISDPRPSRRSPTRCRMSPSS